MTPLTIAQALKLIGLDAELWHIASDDGPVALRNLKRAYLAIRKENERLKAELAEKKEKGDA